MKIGALMAAAFTLTGCIAVLPAPPVAEPSAVPEVSEVSGETAIVSAHFYLRFASDEQREAIRASEQSATAINLRTGEKPELMSHEGTYGGTFRWFVNDHIEGDEYEFRLTAEGVHEWSRTSVPKAPAEEPDEHYDYGSFFTIDAD